jgi:hypothetical protein
MVYLAERAGYTLSARPRLTVDAAAIKIDDDIELLVAGCDQKRLPDDKSVFALAKIFTDILAVYRDFAVTIADIDAGNGCFSSSGSNSKVFHQLLLLKINQFTPAYQAKGKSGHAASFNFP